MDPIIAAIVKALEGVPYIPELGAACPWCGHRLKVTHTMQRRVNRIRYHRCSNTACPLHTLGDMPGVTIKSIQPPVKVL